MQHFAFAASFYLCPKTSIVSTRQTVLRILGRNHLRVVDKDEIGVERKTKFYWQHEKLITTIFICSKLYRSFQSSWNLQRVSFRCTPETYPNILYLLPCILIWSSPLPTIKKFFVFDILKSLWSIPKPTWMITMVSLTFFATNTICRTSIFLTKAYR